MRRIAVCVLLVLIGGAALFLWRAPVGYAKQDRDQIASSATALHMTGTDELGRDRTVRTAGALLLGMAGSLSAAAIASFFAVGLGVFAAFSRPWASRLLMYLCDLFLTLPWIFLLMIVRAALPLTLTPAHSALLTFLLLGLLGAPVFIRVNHARAMAVRNADWLLQGRAAGLQSLQIMRVHVLPHLRPLFVTQFLIYVPVCVVAEANLGTLGLGISEPLPSWGSMLLELQNSALLAGSSWVYLPIGLLVLVLVCLELLVSEVDA